MRFSISVVVALTSMLLSCADALPAATAASTLSSCDALAPQAAIDIRSIDAVVRALNTSATTYSGGLLAASPLNASVAHVHVVNRKAYLDAQAVYVLTAAQSTTIVEVVENTVGVSFLPLSKTPYQRVHWWSKLE